MAKKKKKPHKPRPSKKLTKEQIKQRQKHQQATTKTKPSKKELKKASHLKIKEVAERLSPTRTAIWLLVIAVVTLIAYKPAFDNEFVNWDDTRYVVEEREDKQSGEMEINFHYPYITELSGENIKKMFFGTKEERFHMGNYHPLTMLSLAIDYQISGTEPTAYHATNIAIHVINSLLVFWLIFFILQQAHIRHAFSVSVIAALLFAVHPLHVESVAWISERKDVLYTMFFLLAAITYVRYIKTQKIALLLLVFGFYILSLFSKGQAVSLALTVVVLDYFLQRKLFSIRVIIEKIPFFALALVFGLIAIEAQSSGDAIRSGKEFAYFYRILFASYGFTMYFVKLLVPHQLAAIYPYPIFVDSQPPSYFWLFLIPMAFFVWLFVASFRRNKYLAFGLAFFMANVIFVLQLLPVGSAIMADRYAYIPSIGFFFIVGIGYKKLIEHKPKLRVAGIGVLTLYTLAMMAYTYRQSDVWKDSLTLWNHSLAISPEAAVAWNNRGSAKNAVDDTEGAIADFTQAVTLKPDYANAFYNRGTALKDIKQFQQAVADFNKALEFKPEFAEALQNRGIAKENLADMYLAQGDTAQTLRLYDEALQDYNRGLELRPDLVSLYSSRGVVKGKMGNLDAAIEDFTRGIQMKPSAEAYSNRGFAKVQQGRLEEGIADYNLAIQMRSNYPDAYYNRGMAYFNLEQWQQALSDLNTAIGYKQDKPIYFFHRGLTYTKIGQNQKACEDFQVAKQMGMQGLDYYISLYCTDAGGGQ